MEEDRANVIDVPPFAATKRPSGFTFFTERYFSQYCVRNCKGIDGNIVRLLLHSNLLCVVCIDPSHAALTSPLYSIARIHHDVKKGGGKVVNRQEYCDNNVLGKKKKNALLCQKDTTLCVIETTNGGPVFKIPACVDGFVLEVNPFLACDPSLAARAPLNEGFVAIINPRNGMIFREFEKVSTATSGDFGADEN